MASCRFLCYNRREVITMENGSKPRICVAGIGAIGGLLAALIGRSRRAALSVIARGARKEALRQNGVILNSDLFGHIVARPEAVAEDGEIGRAHV